MISLYNAAGPYNSRTFRQAHNCEVVESSTNIVGLGPVVESLPATKSCPSTHDQTVAVSHILRVSSPLTAQPPLKGQQGLPAVPCAGLPAEALPGGLVVILIPKFVYAVLCFFFRLILFSRISLLLFVFFLASRCLILGAVMRSF